MEQREISVIAGGNAKWHNHFRRQFSSFLQTHHTFTLQSNNQIPWHLLPKLRTYVHTKTSNVYVYETFFHNGQNLGGTKISFYR
jgi:lysozyme family protein